MDCQSRCLLKALIPLMFQEPLGFGVPCLGQRLHVGIDERTHATKILVSTKNAVILLWPNECSLQKVHAPSPHCTRI